MDKIKLYPKNDTELAILAPYSKKFITRIKGLGGKWANPTWLVPLENEQYVRNLLVELFGTDGTETDLVSVEVRLPEGLSQLQGPIFLFGKLIASARGRDSGATVERDVALLEGEARSGGSVKNWDTVLTTPTTLVIRNVPRVAVERKLNWDDSFGSFDILVEQTALDRNSLIEKKERLLQQIADIDRQLTEVGG